MEHDFGDKFRGLRDIETLREYVIVHQTRVEIVTFLRDSGGNWKTAFFTDRAGTVPIASLGIEVSVAEIYDGVTFEQNENAESPAEA